jgi:WD40-like Beta Propeller Repeat
MIECKKHDPEPPMYSCPVGWDSLTVAAINVDTLLSCAVLPCNWQCEENPTGPTRYDYTFPCFNPDNSDEITFIRYDTKGIFGENFELCVLNLCTGELKIIHNKVLGYLDWSVKNWIIFTGRNHMLYKIKPNGDSLTQLTFTGSFNNHPVWSPDGSKFVWYQQVGSTGYRIISDEFGIKKDTLPITENASRFEWISRSKIAFDYGETGQLTARIGIIDIDSYEIQYDVFNLDGFAPFPGTYLLNMDWIESEQSMLFSTKLGVAKTNIHTKQRTTLTMGYAQTRWYNWVRLSPDGKFCLMNRRDAKSDICTVDFMERLYRINLDGTNEQWIKPPE